MGKRSQPGEREHDFECVNFQPSGPLKVTCCKWQLYYITSFWFMYFYCTSNKLCLFGLVGRSVRKVRTRCGRERRSRTTELWGRREEQIQLFVFQLSLTSSLLFSSEISLSPTENTRLQVCTNQPFAGLVVLFGEVGGGAGSLNTAKCDIIAMWF